MRYPENDDHCPDVFFLQIFFTRVLIYYHAKNFDVNFICEIMRMHTSLITES